MEMQVVGIETPDDVNVIAGQAHFIKTVEDLHEVMAQTVPQSSFGIAFCESSGPALIRLTGNDPAMTALAADCAGRIAAGHLFVVCMRGAFPVAVLNAIKGVPEVCGIFCATANPVQFVVAVTEQGRGVMGVIDGVASRGVETEDDRRSRHGLLRSFGYKL
jgi:adenosine/AMP kinase